MSIRVILDTDIGSDVDDAMALSLCLRSEEIELEGVTTVYGDVHLRARLAMKLMQLAGFPDIPVAAGIEVPLLREREVSWGGYEGEGVLTSEDKKIEPISQHAVDFIIDRVMANKDEITLIPIGPLTNVAMAIIREPRIIHNLKEVVLMGGVTRLGDNGVNLPVVEHNVKSDPEAARILFNSGIPITMVGLDVTMKVTIGRDDVNRISQVGTPFTSALVRLLEKWLSVISADRCCMHDPLAVAVAIDRSFVTTERMKVAVETKGELTGGMTVATSVRSEDEGNTYVCLDVDSERFVKFLLDRICKV